MDIFNQGKELLQDVFYTDIRHFKNFTYMRSTFTEKWYNLIVPSVPPQNLDLYMVYKILDEETRNGYAVSLYIPHHMYGAYKPFLQQKQFVEAVDDIYVRYLLNGGEGHVEGDFREVDSSLLVPFIQAGEECFPEWPNQADYSRFCLKLHTDLVNNEDKQNYNILLFERGEVVAFASLLLSRRLRLGYIHNVGTVPARRRKGYFEKVVRHLLHLALEEGISVVYANVENHGASFHGFHKLGFQENCRYHLFSK